MSENMSASATIAKRVRIMLSSVGSHTVVQNNPLARLMYYLNCIASVVNLEVDIPNISRLNDFHRYYDLSVDEIDEVIRHCSNLKPELFEGRCICLSPGLCKGKTNEFYHLQQDESTLIAAGIELRNVAASLVVEGHSVQVMKFMVYDGTWIPTFYHGPMTKLRPWLEAMQSGSTRPARQCGIKMCPKSPFPGSDDPFSKNFGANLLISYFFPLWIFIWITMTFVQS